jgi:hypothetical protein
VSLSLRHIPYRRHNHHRRKILIIDPVKIKSKEFQTFENCRQYQQLTQVGQNKTWKTSNFLPYYYYFLNTQVSASGLRALGV